MTQIQPIACSQQVYYSKHWAPFRRALDGQNFNVAKKLAEQLVREKGFAADDHAKIWALVVQNTYKNAPLAEAFELGLKARALSTDGVLNQELSFLLADIAVEITEPNRKWPVARTPDDLNRAKTSLANFLQRPLPLTALDRLSDQERYNWFTLLTLFLPFRYFEYQHGLAAALMRADISLRQKMFVVLDYLFSARRAIRADYPLDFRLVRQAAEYCLDKLAAHKASCPEWDSEMFQTIVVNLVALGFNDLVEKAVEQYPPAPDDQLHAYLELWRTHVAGRNADAYVRAMAALRENPPARTLIDQETNILMVTIIKSFLINEPAPNEAELVKKLPDNLLSEVLFQPRAAHQAIVRQVDQLRARLFEKILRRIENKAFVFICGSDGGQFLPAKEDAPLVIYLLYVPGERELTQFIDLHQKSVVRVEFRLEKDKDGRLSRILPAAGFSPIERPALVWECLSVCMLADICAKHFGADPVVSEGINKVRAGISVAAQQIFADRTSEIIKGLITDFRQKAGFLDPDMQEAREARLSLCQRILERTQVEVTDGQFQLAGSGLPIYPLIDRIEFLSPERIRKKMFDLCCMPVKENSFGVIFHLGSGQELLAIAEFEGGLPLVSFHGREGDHDKELFDYVDDALLRAIIELFVARSTKTGDLNGGASVIDQDGILEELDRAADSGLARLQDIYLDIFLTNIAKHGLLATKWFTFERDLADPKDGLFKPLLAQSRQEKLTALKDLGPDRLFIQLQPQGKFRRLRVGPKKGPDGQIGLYPWEPSELRKAQQVFFQDGSKRPERFGLYVLTTFQTNGGKTLLHGHLYRLADTMEEALDDRSGALLDQLKTKLKAGEFLKPEVLLSYDEKTRREYLMGLLKAGRLAIKDQTHQIFPVNYTYYHPKMATVGFLRDKGLELEPTKI